MKITELKVKDKVKDTWFHDKWGTGTVKKVLKTRVHIDFTLEGLVVFDEPHLQFLEKV